MNIIVGSQMTLGDYSLLQFGSQSSNFDNIIFEFMSFYNLTFVVK